ncbi:MAG: phosphate ABC transporter ATP-binding protein PstB [Lactobacillaceae bacterium]|jgi:phosphate transport system ATP-binding protein|nr:phosphate ABC transporter ATP-binding protein PstB [Lactobacillaceae bacterium]
MVSRNKIVESIKNEVEIEKYVINLSSKHQRAIETKDLTISYNGKKNALNKTNLAFETNKITSLIGASGSGKSTFLRSLNLIHGENTLIGGQILYHGVNINDPSIDKFEVRRRIGMVFQRPNPFAKSIYNNITFALTQRAKYTKNQLDEIVESSLKQAALWDQVKDELNKSALSLSGGQQQRLVIARALALKPDILLLDEPASALDPKSTMQVEETMVNLKKDYTIIVVTHNMQQAARVSDYTAFFHMGNVIEYDLTRKIFTRPKVKLTSDYVAGNFG